MRYASNFAVLFNTSFLLFFCFVLFLKESMLNVRRFSRDWRTILLSKSSLDSDFVAEILSSPSLSKLKLAIANMLATMGWLYVCVQWG